jgi:hypothetical protein
LRLWTYLRFISQLNYLLLEPLELTANPEAEKEDEVTKVVEAILDEVVNRLLNEAAETVLKEE